VETRLFSHKTRKSVKRCDLYRFARNKKVTGSKKWTRMMTISRICRTALLKGWNSNVCLWGKVPDVITHVKFNVDRFGGFWFLKVQKSGVPLTRREGDLRPAGCDARFQKQVFVNWWSQISGKTLTGFRYWRECCVAVSFIRVVRTVIVTITPKWSSWLTSIWVTARHALSLR